MADWTGSGAAADARPEVNDSGIEELIERVKSYQARRCILETQPKGRAGGTQLCPLLRHGRHEALPLRSHKNILRWQLIFVGGFNLSLMLRQLTGAGTRRE